MHVFFIGLIIGAVIGVMVTHVYHCRLWKKEIARLRAFVRDMGRTVSSSRDDGDKVLNLEEEDREQQGVSS